jgi:hypothetical protein
MADFVAVDFNPRLPITPFFIEFRRNGTYKRSFICAVPTELNEKFYATHRRIEIRRYKIGHPYGILNKKVCRYNSFFKVTQQKPIKRLFQRSSFFKELIINHL